MIPTSYDPQESIETFKNESDSDSDSEPPADTNTNTNIKISDDGTNYIVKGKHTSKKSNIKKVNNLIGEGTFGCIYDDLNNPGKVHKIFLYDYQYDEELHVSIMLYKAFKSQQIIFPDGLLLPDNLHDSDIPNTIERNYLTSSGYKVCKLLKDKNNTYNKESYKYLTYTNGGAALNETLDSFNTVFDLLVAFDSIFDAIAKLEDVHIAHHDIKMPNILYNKDTHNTILIDYGITYKYKDLFIMNPTNNKNWPKTYFVWPPEFHTIWYIMTNKSVPSVRVMSDKIKSVVDIDETYVPSFKDMYIDKDYYSDLDTFRITLVDALGFKDTVDREIHTIDNGELSKYFATHFGNKSDTYGLAMLLYAFNKHSNYLSKNNLETQLVIYLELNSINELSESQHAFCKNVRSMIHKMGLPNPYARYSANKANDMYTKLIRTELHGYKNNNLLDTVNKKKEIIETFLTGNTVLMNIMNIHNTQDSTNIYCNPFYICVASVIFITLIILLVIYTN